MATVKQSGGDYGTLAAATAAAETTISIEGTWTAADTTVVAISTANTVITTDSDSKHPGYTTASSPTYYRLETSTSAHTITVTAASCSLTGVVIRQLGSTTSAEAVRFDNDGELTFTNCIIAGSATPRSQQDGIYVKQDASSTLNITQCAIIGFGRCGVNLQNFSTGKTDTQVLNANSCVFYRNGENDGSSSQGGGIGIERASSSQTMTANIYNTIAIANDTASPGGDYRGSAAQAAGITWNISRCIDGDNSIATVLDTGSNNLASRTETASATPGAGDWVIFESITGYPHVDLRLQDVPAENDAQDVHSTATAHGLTIPSTDIVGTSRPQNTDYDTGPFEIVAAANVSDAVTPVAIVWSGAPAEAATANVADAVTSATVTWSGALAENATDSQSDAVTPVDVVWSGSTTDVATANVADAITAATVTWSGTLAEAITANVVDTVTPSDVLWSGSLAEAATANVSDAVTSFAVNWSGTLAESAGGNVADTVTAFAVTWGGSLTESITENVYDAIAAETVLWSGAISESVTANVADVVTATAVLWGGSLAEAVTANLTDAVTPTAVVWSGTLSESSGGNVADTVTSETVTWGGSAAESVAANVSDAVTSFHVLWSGSLAEAVTANVSDAITPTSILWSGVFSESTGGDVSDAVTPAAVVWSGSFSDAITTDVVAIGLHRDFDTIGINRDTATLSINRTTSIIVVNRDYP